VKKQIRDARCAAACPDMRARLEVESTEVVSSADEISYKVKWWLRIYCFEEGSE
jgi:hypothetical protein